MAGTSILATICAERLTKFIARYSKAQTIITRNNSGQARRLLPALDPTRRASIPQQFESKYKTLWQQPDYQLHVPALAKPKPLDNIYAQTPKRGGTKACLARLLPPQLPLSPQARQLQQANFWFGRFERQPRGIRNLQLQKSQVVATSRKFLAVQQGHAKVAALPKLQQLRPSTVPKISGMVQIPKSMTKLSMTRLPPAILGQQMRQQMRHQSTSSQAHGHTADHQSVPVLARYAYAGANALMRKRPKTIYCQSYGEYHNTFDRLRVNRDCY